MKHPPSRLFFDTNDHALLAIVNEVVQQHSPTLRSLMAPYMHPRGIKEMAAPAGLRIAYAIARMLESLEAGQGADRLTTLRTLYEEVLASDATFFRNNTARVLLQIVKELVRSRDDELRQLELAHDFRRVFAGKLGLVRRQLAHYHLLEMPEEWNQYAFDDRVHDANTKGRKSPTHLLMDAWIKGIRKLTVIYYNYVEPEAAWELLEGAAILGIHARIGIEYSACFREKFIRVVWELDGFFDNTSLLDFLKKEAVVALMRQGRLVSLYQQEYVFGALDAFNHTHRQVLDAELGVQSPPLERSAFLSFVGAGQPSLLHLAACLLQQYHDLFRTAASASPKTEAEETDERTDQEPTGLEKLCQLNVDHLIDRFLQPDRNPHLPNPNAANSTHPRPALLHLSLPELLDRLAALHAASRFTLGLDGLSVQDALELLYICRGKITHLEVFSLKSYSYDQAAMAQARDSGLVSSAMDRRDPDHDRRLINKLQQALNADNVIILKRVIRAIIWDFERMRLIAEQQCEQEQQTPEGESPESRATLEAMNERKDALINILLDLGSFHALYRKRYLGSRIGSGSTGQSSHQYGMGLAVLDTLPRRAVATVLQQQQEGNSKLIPVTARMISHRHRSGPSGPLRRLLRRFPGRRWSEPRRQWYDWTLDRLEPHPGTSGNLVILGGLRQSREARCTTDPPTSSGSRSLHYLNSHLTNALKVLAGFIPAFLTFFLTKDWWLLAYGGAFIWFGITGARNIIQSILGGGGVKRSPLLRWNSLVSWSRIADSLFFTGFSVPLLDYLVKTLLLDQSLGITTATNPLILYAAMGLTNGLYIFTHNTLRGLPRSAAIGNLFRSALSIPLALLFNSLFAGLLHLAMVPGVEATLQKWAAIISKLASDCVAAVIEGLADRQNNILLRRLDYQAKIAQLFSVFARLDVLFPEEDVLDMLQAPEKAFVAMGEEAEELKKIFIVNALDLMYFWMYQPRARKTLQDLVVHMSDEEWLIFYRSQLVLRRDREISQVFVDGLVGRNFAQGLSFYLGTAETYLADMEALGKKREKLIKKRAQKLSTGFSR